MKNPDNQIAFRAAQLLGDIGKEPSLTVPALLDQVLGKDRLMVVVATLALVHFPEQADVIIPVLREVQANTNSAVPRWASARALKELEKASRVKNGVDRHLRRVPPNRRELMGKEKLLGALINGESLLKQVGSHRPRSYPPAQSKESRQPARTPGAVSA